MPHRHYRYLLVLTVFSYLNLVITALTTQLTPDVLGTHTDISSAGILALVNLERQQRGLQPLRLSQQLNQAAQAKATDMIEDGYFAHVTNTDTPWSFIDASGYIYTHAGENLARNYTTNQAVVEAWMNSPTHKANILNQQYSETGLAVITAQTNSPQPVIVQMFAAPYISGETGQYAAAGITTARLLNDTQTSKVFISLAAMLALALTATVVYQGVRHHPQSKPASSLWRK